MSYVFKQKLNIGDLVEIETARQRVLVSMPYADLSGLYAHYLRSQDFVVSESLSLGELLKDIAEFRPHLAVISTDYEQNSLAVLKVVKRIKNFFPELPLVSVGDGLSVETLKNFMSEGVVSHIERRFSRPHDVVTMVKFALKK